jgi:hypothetical protein
MNVGYGKTLIYRHCTSTETAPVTPVRSMTPVVESKRSYAFPFTFTAAIVFSPGSRYRQ